jgi:Uma2 family endonuclease
VSTDLATALTAQDLLNLSDSSRYELVDGQLVERNMGSESSWIGGEIFFVLKAFSKAHQLGWVWPADNSFQAFAEDPQRVRRPDVSFVRFDRLPHGRLSKGHELVTPNLAVEVVSPNDRAEEIEIKVGEYLRAGVQLVWIVYPEARTVQVYRPDGSSQRLSANEEISGEDVLPGFRYRVGDFFPPASPEHGNGQEVK